MIPEIECVPLPDNALCCGASGSQLLNPSEISLSLRQKKLESLIHLKTSLDIDTKKGSAPFKKGIDTLITSNIGCALHLAAGLRAQNQNVEVLHPVTLLFRQLEKTETCTPQLASATAKVVI